MNPKLNRPPEHKPFIWLTLEMIESDAWRSLGINSRRVIDFLLREWMKTAGQHNGKLKAPDLQLRKFGIGARHISDAIRKAELMGLIECRRGGMRIATLYTLTWLPSHDGNLASNKWRQYRNPSLKPLPARKHGKLRPDGRATLPPDGKLDAQDLPAKGKVVGPNGLPPEGRVLLRNFLPRQVPTDSVIKAEHGSRPRRWPEIRDRTAGWKR